MQLTNILEPDAAAAQFRMLIKQELAAESININLIGLLVAGDNASETYARYTQLGCDDVGIHFELIKVTQRSIWDLLTAVNNDTSIHGIFIYYPIFADERDTELRNTIAWQKDVEGLTAYWMNKLYSNQRFDDTTQVRKAILPCTPLAIIKILEKTDCYQPQTLPMIGRTISIFNRSEVVGRPLAYMLSNDGAIVYSFDIHGGIIVDTNNRSQLPINRKQALGESDVVISGVPTNSFRKIEASELKPGAIGISFTHVQNFTDEAKKQTRLYVPRIGTMTVAMCLRNALRLYRNYHQR